MATVVPQRSPARPAAQPATLTSATLIRLTVLVGALALITAAAGLFWPGTGQPFVFTTVRGQEALIHGQGLYRYDTLFSAAAFKGGDLVTLVVALPLLALATLHYRRGSLRGAFLLAGMLSFFLYNSASLAFSAAFNPLFLVYVAIFSASLFAFICALTAIDRQVLPAHIAPGVPQHAIAIFLCVAGVGTALVWLMELIEPLRNGTLPAGIASSTTPFTHGLDIGVIMPAAIAGAVLVLRRDPLGYVLAFPVLCLCALIGLVVLAQTGMQLSMGVELSTGQIVGIAGTFLALSLVACGLLFAFFGKISEVPRAPAR